MTLLVAIEGIDGSGKGTQAARLSTALEAAGRSNRVVSFPRYGQTRFGQLIGRYLNGEFGALADVDPYLVCLLFAGDRYESRGWVDEQAGGVDVLIFDRYIASNIAHQAAKQSLQRRDELRQFIMQLEREVYGLPDAELTVLLDVSVITAQRLIARKSSRDYTQLAADLQEADAAYLQAVREEYQLLARQPSWRTIACERGGQLRPLAEITSELAQLVLARLEGL